MTKSYLFKMMIKKGEPSYSHKLSYKKINLDDIIKYKTNDDNMYHYCKVKSLNPVVIKITKLDFVNQKFFVIHELDDTIDAYLIIKNCEGFIVDNDQLM